MRWLSFFILAYIALGLQLGLSRAIEWKSAFPDFVLLAVVFLGLNAPRDAALLGCFLLGLLRDLSGDGTLGLYALSYGLVAIFIVGVQQAVNRRHPVTHFLLTLIGGTIVALVLAIHEWMHPADVHMRTPIGPLFYSAFYSAALALFLIPALNKANWMFQFERTSWR